MKINIKKLLQFIIFLALGVVLLYYAFRDINVDHLKDSLKKANYFWIFLSIIFAWIALISRAARWNILIHPLGYKPKLFNSYHALCIMYVSNIAFPRLGEVTRCGSLNRTDNVPIDKLLGTVILERVIDLITLLTLMLVVFFVKIDFFGKFFMENIISPIYDKFSLSLFKLSVLGIIFLIFIVVLILIRKRLEKIRFIKKIFDFISGTVTGLKSIFKMKQLGWFLFHTLVIWGMYFLMTYVVFFSVDITQGLTPIDGLFIMVVGGLGMSAPVQGGFGAFHWAVSLALMLYGIKQEDGLIFATLQHESQALFLITMGGISFFTLILQKKKKNGQPS